MQILSKVLSKILPTLKFTNAQSMVYNIWIFSTLHEQTLIKKIQMPAVIILALEKNQDILYKDFNLKNRIVNFSTRQILSVENNFENIRILFIHLFHIG